MANDNVKISILSFPQSIQNKVLKVNFLVIPRNFSPFEEQVLPEGILPPIAEWKLNLQAVLLGEGGKIPLGAPDPPLPSGTFVNEIGYQVEDVASVFRHFENIYRDTYKAIIRNPLNASERAPALNESRRIQKYLPLTYREAFNFSHPRTSDAKTDDSYHCALRNRKAHNKFVPTSETDVTWGQIYALCLRQPALARKVGFVREYTLTLSETEAGFFEKGGWVFAEIAGLEKAGEIRPLAPSLYKSYMAPIPPLAQNANRALFACNQIPLGGKIESGYTRPLIELAAYDDGFAKVVHAFQPISTDVLAEKEDGNPPAQDIGFRLAWDDEQVLIWQNRLLNETDATDNTKRLDAPTGVLGYRVDVKKDESGEWHRLCAITPLQNIQVGNIDLLRVNDSTELGVEVHPIQIDGNPDLDFWLPAYFTQWTGKSLVLPDRDAVEIFKLKDIAPENRPAKDKEMPEQHYRPLLLKDGLLQYGHDYRFRVRLMDLTGGGPDVSRNPENEGPAPSSKRRFRRYVAPHPVRFIVDHDDPQQLPPNPGTYIDAAGRYMGTTLSIQRPLLEYPSVAFTGKYSEPVALLKAQVQELLDNNRKKEAGLADPDVDRVEITVELRSLDMDLHPTATGAEPYIMLYRTQRRFPDPIPGENYDQLLNINIVYKDARVVVPQAIDPAMGDLALADIDDLEEIILPTSRDIRLTITPLAEEKADTYGYYGSEQSKVGKPFAVKLRAESKDETDLFHDTDITQRIKAIYLQPDPILLTEVVQQNSEEIVKGFLNADSPLASSSLMARLAAATGLNAQNLDLYGKAGTRIQFGCSRRIRHTLSPDGAAITFSSQADLLQHWLVFLDFSLRRDWTWDGLDILGFKVLRRKKFSRDLTPLQDVQEEAVGNLEWRRTADANALQKADRSFMRMVFIDAVEPKPDDPEAFPDTIEVSYRLVPIFKNGGTPNLTPAEWLVGPLFLLLVNPPRQIPEVVSAGFALTPFVRDEAYGATQPRQRYLWLEFDKPPLDPSDALFYRYLAYAPDPWMTNMDPAIFRASPPPPLPIDPEPTLVITPRFADSRSGLDAMFEPEPVLLEPGDSPRHYIIPLPAGLNHESPELFGFFTLEMRVGHKAIPSSAQGRFGRPLEIIGVQHPAPALSCTVFRSKTGLWASAPYATAVHGGKDVTAQPPRTQIWALLYAQAQMADGSDFRNILLDDKVLLYKDPRQKPEALEGLLQQAFSGYTYWDFSAIRQILQNIGLPEDAPLSVLCVEMMPNFEGVQLPQRPNDAPPYEQVLRDLGIMSLYSPNEAMPDNASIFINPDRLFDREPNVRPLTTDLGKYRILRTSPLVSVEESCCLDC